MELALGYCSWRPGDFWDSTWYELSCAINGTKKYGVVALVAKMFGGGGKPTWTEAEALYIANQLDERREELERPSNVVELRRALKATRRG